MNKTKIGLTANAYAALIFAAGLLGFLPVVLLAGAALILEENEWLKRMSVKAVAFIVIIEVVSVVIMLLPDVLDWIAQIINNFSNSTDLDVLYKINGVFSWLNNALGIVAKVLLIVYAYQAYLGKYAKVLFVENMVNKNM